MVFFPVKRTMCWVSTACLNINMPVMRVVQLTWKKSATNTTKRSKQPSQYVARYLHYFIKVLKDVIRTDFVEGIIVNLNENWKKLEKIGWKVWTNITYTIGACSWWKLLLYSDILWSLYTSTRQGRNKTFQKIIRAKKAKSDSNSVRLELSTFFDIAVRVYLFVNQIQ